MVAGQDVKEKIAALEEALKRAAFDVLAENRSYDQATKLLRLAESLSDLEDEYAKVMHPAASQDDGDECRWWGRTFPRFCVRNGRLVKEGKGKKSLVPYTQEVDRGGFDVVVRWIARHDQEPWQMGQMVEELSSEVAGYKPYVVVGALSETGLVRRVKRGSYRAAGEVSTERWWDLLECGPSAVSEELATSSTSQYAPDDEEIPF